MFEKRIRNQSLLEKIVSAREASLLIKDGMTVGMSGFTRAGDAKAVPLALAERVKSSDRPFKINVFTGASLGDVETALAETHLIHKRLPFQVNNLLRSQINNGEVLFIDQHLSQTAELVRSGHLPPIDVAIIEAVAITENGGIVPTTSVGNSAIYASQAKEVIVELNIAMPEALEGIHDIYDPGMRGSDRQPIAITGVEQRIGTSYIPMDPEKIKAIVISDQMDTPASLTEPDAETIQIANHLIEFFRNEVKAGRLPKNLAPMQSGIGSVANAVLHGFLNSEFTDLKVYSEVLQDAMFDLIDAGKITFASACSITVSEECASRIFPNIDRYKDKLVLRPQEISNHPEVIRRLGLICMNTAIEFDIYGNVNSTHVTGTKMMNGIGGSGDFARNGLLGIFVTKSTAKDGKISSVVPMVSHVDHTEHDVDILVTEQGLADLRGLAPRERARVIIDKCVHPMYKDALNEYFEAACKRGGQTPHILEEALSWHVRYAKEGTMLQKEISHV